MAALSTLKISSCGRLSPTRGVKPFRIEVLGVDVSHKCLWARTHQAEPIQSDFFSCKNWHFEKSGFVSSYPKKQKKKTNR
jgi:hypothetical protein